MHYWLLKSEPESYAWDDLVRDKGTEWDGIRNHAAAKHLREMAVGDRALIYHSGKDKAAVGIAEVTRTAQADGEAPWVSVAIKPVEALPALVTLAAMKGEPKLKDMEMLRQSRLSASPVRAAEWQAILALAKQ